MKRNVALVLLVGFVLLILLLGVCAGFLLYHLFSDVEDHLSDEADSVFVASWNLQNFGRTKAENDSLLEYYAEKIGAYDVCVIQEIQDPSGQALVSLAERVPSYQYVLSTPAGHGEQ